MATSGVYVLEKSAVDIVKKALLLCRAYDPSQSLQAIDRETGIDCLNDMMKYWQGQGYHLWNNEDAVLFCEASKQSYLLGPSGDHTCIEDDFINTEIATAAVALDTDLVVDDSTGMSGAPDIFTSNQATDVNAWTATNATLAVASDKLTITNSGAAAGYAEIDLEDLVVGKAYRITYGYEVGTSTSATFSVISDSSTIATATQTATDTYTLDFTATQTTAQFRAANVSTTSGHTTLVTAMNYVRQDQGDFCGIELDDGTRQWVNIVSISGNTLSLDTAISSAAAVDNTVYTYSTKIQRPLRLHYGRYLDNVSSDEVPINDWSRSDYMMQTDKTASGTIVNMYYQPKLTNGKLYVWQTASNVKNLVKFSYQEPLQIVEENADSPEFPSEWFLPIAYNLAAMIGPEYKTPTDRQMQLEAKAAQLLESVLGWDDEDVSIFLQPQYD